MNDEKKELVWVGEKFAKKYKEINNKAEQIKYFDEYIESIRKNSKEEFRANLDNLDEDVVIYKGLMLNVKQAFEKAKNEQLNASYELWGKFEKDIPSTKEKTQKIIDILKPLVEKLTEVNSLMGKIQTYNFDKVLETVSAFNRMSVESKEMMQFLIKNYKQ